MIHTFDLSYHINKEIFESIFAYLRHKGNTYKKHPDHKYYVNNFWNCKGISAVTLCIDKRGYSLEFTISPKIIYEEDESALFIKDDLRLLRKKFSSFINELNYNIVPYILPTDIDMYALRRLDYTMDFSFPSPGLAINIFSKGLVPYGFNVKVDWNYCYKLSSKRYNYLVYDKSYDLQNKYGLTDVSSRLRVEVQNHRCGLKKIASEYGLDKINLSNLWSDEICRNELKRAIKCMVGDKPFTTYDNLKRAIYESDLPWSYKKSAEGLIMLLNYHAMSLTDIKKLERAYGDNDEFINQMLEIKKRINKDGKYLTKKKRCNLTKSIKNVSFHQAKMYVERVGYSPILLPDGCQCEYLGSIVDMVDEKRV